MQRRIRIGIAAVGFIGGEREIVGVEEGINLPELIAINQAGLDTDRLLVGDVLTEPVLVLRSNDLNEP